MTKRKTKQISIVQKTQIVLDNDEAPVIWVREFNFEAAETFVQRLVELDSNPDVPQIYVFIMSYGGEIYPLFAMIEAMKSCRKPVNTVGLGMCASCASVLLSAGTGTRWLSKNSFVHIHHVRAGAFDDLPALQHSLEQTKVAEDKLLSILTERSKMSVKELRNKLEKQKKEWQLTSATAKKYGFIDRIGIPSLKRYLVTEAEE